MYNTNTIQKGRHRSKAKQEKSKEKKETRLIYLLEVTWNQRSRLWKYRIKLSVELPRRRRRRRGGGGGGGGGRVRP